MRQHTAMFTLSLLGGVFVLGLLALAWMLGPGASQAVDATIQNCPQPGKWAISVWGGADGTETGEALATCGEGAAAAAYYLDPETQVWWRWFAGRPQVSNLSMVNDMQGVLALGSAQVQATPVLGLPNPASVYCVELGYELRIVDADGQVGICVFPDGTQCEEWSFFEGECGQGWALEADSSHAQDGTMHNCPQPGKWAISVWDGPDGTPTGQALAMCGEEAVAAAYYLDPDTQSWLRYFRGRPEITSLGALDYAQGVIALGTTATVTSTPTSVATPTLVPIPSATPTSTAVVVADTVFVYWDDRGYYVLSSDISCVETSLTVNCEDLALGWTLDCVASGPSLFCDLVGLDGGGSYDCYKSDSGEVYCESALGSDVCFEMSSGDALLCLHDDGSALGCGTVVWPLFICGDFSCALSTDTGKFWCE